MTGQAARVVCIPDAWFMFEAKARDVCMCLFIKNIMHEEKMGGGEGFHFYEMSDCSLNNTAPNERLQFSGMHVSSITALMIRLKLLLNISYQSNLNYKFDFTVKQFQRLYSIQLDLRIEI